MGSRKGMFTRTLDASSLEQPKNSSKLDRLYLCTGQFPHLFRVILPRRTIHDNRLILPRTSKSFKTVEGFERS